MRRIYPLEELDAIVRAAMSFKESYPNDHFYSGNLADGQVLSPSEALKGTLTKKMRYVADLNLDVLYYLGFGTDNIEYFEIGPNAKVFLSEGGFKKYFEQLGQQERTEKIRMWSPILISLFALLIAALSYFHPVNKNLDTKDLKHQIDTLEQRQKAIEIKLEKYINLNFRV